VVTRYRASMRRLHSAGSRRSRGISENDRCAIFQSRFIGEVAFYDVVIVAKL